MIVGRVQTKKMPIDGWKNQYSESSRRIHSRRAASRSRGDTSRRGSGDTSRGSGDTSRHDTSRGSRDTCRRGRPSRRARSAQGLGRGRDLGKHSIFFMYI